MKRNKFLIREDVYFFSQNMIKKWKVIAILEEYYEIQRLSETFKISEKHLFKTLWRCKNRVINDFYDEYRRKRDNILILDN